MAVREAGEYRVATAVLVLQPDSPAAAPWEAGRAVQFAACWSPDQQERRAELLAFAKEYGLLGVSPETLPRPGVGLAGTVTGETLESWELEASQAWECVATLRQQGQLLINKAAMQAFKRVRREASDLLLRLYDAAAAEKPKARTSPRMRELQRIINDGLHRHHVVPLLTGERLPFQFGMEPRTQGGRIWHELAMLATGQSTISVCVRCGKPMYYLGSYQAKDSKRHGAKFCGDACKVAHWRSRQKKKRRTASRSRSGVSTRKGKANG